MKNNFYRSISLERMFQENIDDSLCIGNIFLSDQVPVLLSLDPALFFFGTLNSAMQIHHYIKSINSLPNRAKLLSAQLDLLFCHSVTLIASVFTTPLSLSKAYFHKIVPCSNSKTALQIFVKPFLQNFQTLKVQLNIKVCYNSTDNQIPTWINL